MGSNNVIDGDLMNGSPSDGQADISGLIDEQFKRSYLAT